MISDGNYTYTTIATAATTDEQGIAAAVDLRLMGYTIRETAAAAATLNLCHGTSNATIVAAENLAASTSVSRWFGPQGLPVSGGVYIERLTGGSTQVVLITKVG